MKRRNLIITIAIAAVSLGLAVIIGFSVSNMTASSGREDASANETESGTNAVTPSDQAPDPDLTEAPSETEDPLLFHMENSLRPLSAETCEAFASSYSTEVKRYYTKPELNENGRPIEAVYFQAIFDQKLGKCTHVLNGDDKRVTLSFVLAIEYDENTDYVLNYLSAKDVKAVFFVSYSYAFNHPEIVKRILTEGHTLGSMGYALPETGFSHLSLTDQYNDLKKMHDFIYETYGYSMNKFFYGDLNYSTASMALLRDAGYEPCFFTVSYNDSRHDDVIEAAAFLEAMSEASHNGAVYVLHTTNTASLIITPSLIDALREKGYEIGDYN